MTIVQISCLVHLSKLNYIAVQFQDEVTRLHIYLIFTLLDNVFITGGMEGENSTSEVIRWSTKIANRKKMPSMIECRHAHVMAANKGRIFALGGRKHINSSISFLASAEYFNLDKLRQLALLI